MSEKDATLADLIGKFRGSFGSSPSASIPLGGQVTGPILQSLLGAGIGYGGGQLIGRMLPKVNPHRLGVVMGFGGAGLPWAAHGLGLHGNYKDWKKDPARKGKSWWQQPANFFSAMNQTNPPNIKTSSMEKPAFRIGTASNLPSGYGIPVAHTMGMIRTDPLMSPIEKAKAIALLEAAQPKKTGIISWPTVTRAAVGAGVGFTSATLFGKALDTLFGGLSSPAQRKLQGAGTIAGILLNTGAIR